MLAAATKIGVKYPVNIDIFKVLGAEFEQLHGKEQVMFDFSLQECCCVFVYLVFGVMESLLECCSFPVSVYLDE